MNNKTKLWRFILLLLVVGIWSCNPEADGPDMEPIVPSSGEADFSKFISIGNSLTAGFRDNALFDRGQERSFAKIMSEQFALANGGDFNQPDINSENGFTGMGPDGPLGRLRFNPATGGPTPTPNGDIPAPFTGDKSALNNFGIPGITLVGSLRAETSVPGNPFFNPFYARIATNPGTSTLIGDAAAAMANGGTFFTFWLGNNDVLGYATQGASNPAILTPQAVFEQAIDGALSNILNAAPSAKGVVANIPNITGIPFFTTVGPQTPVLTLPSGDLPPASILNILVNANLDTENGQFTEGPVYFAGEGNRVIIETSDKQVRQYNPQTDFILLTAAGLGLGQPIDGNANRIMGITVAIPDAFVLDREEVAEVLEVINGFNAAIANRVAQDSDRLALLDIFTEFNNLPPVINGVPAQPVITPPTAMFSWDGVHPNARGYAFTANLFIEKINEHFNAQIPLVNPNDFYDYE
ncbi:MAG: hypothetical protein LAT68_06805 [Cyclobacteriaceae bacterium]|nr:hypothetical protein [Cyclobacteriaceae bacterium]MCH8516022.1 hypothetical protein [Cyclobacteriaceae bacterium]